jgi:hypothetical protein
MGETARRFTRRRAYRLSCRAVEATKQKCGVSWSYGPNDYYGSVTIYYTFEAGRVVWNDRYTIHWVNDYCYFDSGHRGSCRVRTTRK